MMEEMTTAGTINKRTEWHEQLKMPKAILVILNNETGEIIAENGRWNRLPMDNEVLRAEYKPNHQKYNE